MVLSFFNLSVGMFTFIWHHSDFNKASSTNSFYSPYRSQVSFNRHITVKALIRSILKRRMSNVNVNSRIECSDEVIVINGEKDIKFHLSTETFCEWSVNELRRFLCRIITKAEEEKIESSFWLIIISPNSLLRLLQYWKEVISEIGKSNFLLSNCRRHHMIIDFVQ